MKRLWTLLIVLLFSLTSCDDGNKNFDEISNVITDDKFALFHFKDGRVFVATEEENENFNYIPPEDLKKVKYVLFESQNKILLEGTQEKGIFISKGRIPLNVREVDIEAIFPAK